MHWSCLAALLTLLPMQRPACTLYWPFCKPAPCIGQASLFSLQIGSKSETSDPFIYWRWILKKINFKMFWRERRLRSVDISIELAQIFSRLRRVFVLRQRRISASLKLHGLHLANSTVDILWATHLFMILKNFSKQKKQDSLTKEINRFPPDDLVLTL